MKIFNLSYKLLFSAIVMSIALAPNTAQAAPPPVFTPFASFSNGYFTFTNLPVGPGNPVPNARFISQVGPQLVNFVFNENVSYAGTNYFNGVAINNVTVTLNASDRGIASTTPVPGGKTFLDQPIQDVTGAGPSLALKFTDNLGHNLLTVSNFTGDIGGFAAGNNANLAGDTSATFVPDVLTYTSDFLTFSTFTGPTPGNDGSYSIGLTLLNGIKLTRNPTNGLLDSFTAIGDGTFTAPPVVAAPEPSGIVSLSVFGGCLALCAARRRKTLAL